MNQIKKTVKLLRRSPYQALAAALAMSLTFFVSYIFIILIIGGQIVLNYIEQRPEVIVFFADEATQTEIDDLTSKVRSTGLTKEIKFVSKEEALAIYRERNKDDPLLLESVTADFLPRSIDISVNRASDIKQITELAQGSEHVDKVITPENLVEQLVKWTKTIRLGGLVFVSTLLSISFLLIIYVLLLFYSPQIQNFLGDIRVFPINPLFFLYLWVAEALAAALIGIIGAAIALYRYLKIRY